MSRESDLAAIRSESLTLSGKQSQMQAETQASPTSTLELDQPLTPNSRRLALFKAKASLENLLGEKLANSVTSSCPASLLAGQDTLAHLRTKTV